MPELEEPETKVKYYVVSYDENGEELGKDGKTAKEGDTLDSTEILTQLNLNDYSDVFVISHGWLGDAAGCQFQYDAWVRAVHKFLAPTRSESQTFKPLVVGIHWPSKENGIEQFRLTGDIGESAESELDELADKCASTIVDTPRAKKIYKDLIKIANSDLGDQIDFETLIKIGGAEESEFLKKLATPVVSLSKKVHNGLLCLIEDIMAKFRKTGKGGIYYLSAVLGELLMMEGIEGLIGKRNAIEKTLDLLSFFVMKERAEIVGRNGPHKFLNAALSQSKARFHLMGHSFGCIVVSSMLCGAKENGVLNRKANTLFLVQGALSVWSYSTGISRMTQTLGQFNRIIENQLVDGPIITTQSWDDKAVRLRFPAAVKALDDMRYDCGLADLNYAAVGAWGIRGRGIATVELEMEDTETEYDFLPGIVYNVDGSRFIIGGDFWSGAHSNIDKSQVAHLLMEAICYRRNHILSNSEKKESTSSTP